MKAILFLLAAFCTAQGADQESDLFPMRTGTEWIYRGDVAWQQGADVRRARLQWKIEIADTVNLGRYTAALLIGHPRDLEWYEAGRPRGCYVLIAVDHRNFYLTECAAGASRQKLTVTEENLAAMITDSNLIFRLPVRQGDTFGGDGPRRDDGMYAWNVQSIQQTSLAEIRGIGNGGARKEYVLAYRTMPDHEIDTYVSGIGLVAFLYGHHGTVSDVDMKLVEFHSPAQAR